MNQDLLAGLAAAISDGSIRVVDLAQTLRPATPVIQLPPQFAPSGPFRIEEISHFDQRGPAWYWNNISCGEHTGTHFDAPAHWITGKDYAEGYTDTIPAQRFVAPACVIDCLEAGGRRRELRPGAGAHRSVGEERTGASRRAPGP